ncbi:MAG TPA: hypothetical protein VHU44_18140 [Acidobacteriaceae bacterium]|jgi:hypothetical protein|nr:hypothetical protein [Acidobacteriaceae bacterium]
MRLLPSFGWLANASKTLVEDDPGGEMNDAIGAPAESADGTADNESHLLKTVGWVSAALGAVALGLLVGRELRSRYKFNRRTPYDMYAHSGDELGDVDWGVGI